MSIDCSVVVWKRHFNGASRKMVAVKLADHADDKGRGIWPSVETIATDCDLSCRTVRRILDDFVTEGILVVVAEGGKGPGSSTRYDMDLAVVKALPLAMAPPDSKSAQRLKTEQKKGDMVSPLDDPKGDTDADKEDTDDNKGDTVSPKPSGTTLEPSLEKERASEAGIVTTARDEEDDLSSYDAMLRSMRKWPSGFDDSKENAFRAWKKLTTEKRRKIEQNLPAYIAAKKALNRGNTWGAFSTFLAEDRIDDLEYSTGKPAASDGPKPAPPFGKAWMAAFLRIVSDRPGPIPAMPMGDRLLIEKNPDRELPLRREHMVKHGWPAANRMLEKLREQRPAHVDATIGRLGTDFVQARRDGAIVAAWDRMAAARGIAWLPEQRPEWIWLPGLPEGAEDLSASELDQAVGAAFDDFKRRIGHEHAA